MIPHFQNYQFDPSLPRKQNTWVTRVQLPRDMDGAAVLTLAYNRLRKRILHERRQKKVTDRSPFP